MWQDNPTQALLRQQMKVSRQADNRPFFQRLRQPVSDQTRAIRNQYETAGGPAFQQHRQNQMNRAQDMVLGFMGGVKPNKIYDPKWIAQGSKAFEKDILSYQRQLAKTAKEAQLQKKFMEAIKGVPVMLKNKRLF